MKHTNMKSISIKKSVGFTLLELMIALSLGILLLMGLMSIYIVANQANNQNKALVANDEIARQVFRILGKNLSHAGYIDPLDAPANTFQSSGRCSGVTAGTQYGSITADLFEPSIENIYRRYNDPTTGLQDSLLTAIGRVSCGAMRPVLGCGSSIGFSSAPNIFNATPSNCSNESANDTSQAIEIASQVMATGGTGNSSLNYLNTSSNATDCTGTNATSAQNGFVVNQYFIMDDSGEQSFGCQSNLNPTNTALVQGVEELMFRYITTSPENDISIDISQTNSGNVLTAYETASGLYTAATANPTSLNWATVVGVEVCVVVATPEQIGGALANLAKTQGNNRPTCTKANGQYVANIAKSPGRENRYYQRFERVFRLPNTLFLPN